MTMEEELLGIGYSFGCTGFENDVQKSRDTIRVETKQCILAYMGPKDLYAVMGKHKMKKNEKML